MRSDYTYKLLEIDGRKIISIIDLDLGEASVTNNIENVVDEIFHKEGIDFKSEIPIILYKDSYGLWSGYLRGTNDFVVLDQPTRICAFYNYLKKEKQFPK